MDGDIGRAWEDWIVLIWGWVVGAMIRRQGSRWGI
jgi:hypothetical protein